MLMIDFVKRWCKGGKKHKKEEEGIGKKEGGGEGEKE